jgi:hypothetical protein
MNLCAQPSFLQGSKTVQLQGAMRSQHVRCTVVCPFTSAAHEARAGNTRSTVFCITGSKWHTALPAQDGAPSTHQPLHPSASPLELTEVRCREFGKLVLSLLAVGRQRNLRVIHVPLSQRMITSSRCLGN